MSNTSPALSRSPSFLSLDAETDGVASASEATAGRLEAAESAEEEEELRLELFLEPPPTGMLRSAPPLVQYLLQFRQKWRG